MTEQDLINPQDSQKESVSTVLRAPNPRGIPDAAYESGQLLAEEGFEIIGGGEHLWGHSRTGH